MTTMTNAGLGAGLETIITARRRLTEGFRTWAARRRQIARTTFELQGYTDRQLADLGMCRSDIADVARGHFRRA